jgi:hypothetical protein
MRNLVNKFTFNNHLNIKNTLLELIEKAPSMNINDNCDQISKSDFYIKDFKKEYADFVTPHIKDFLTVSLKSFNIGGFMIKNIWFQQYRKNDIHKWHTHPNSHFACVYYVDMPDNNQKTLIKEFGSDELIKYDANEGDIIMFPAFLSHSSPVINSDNRKTIISFNLDII